MAPRTTRSAAREAALLAAGADTKLAEPKPLRDNKLESKPSKFRPNGTKRQKAKPGLKPNPDELPHNLGSIPAPQLEGNGFKTEQVDDIATEIQYIVDKAAQPSMQLTTKQQKKSTEKSSYGLSPGLSPFPNYPHPTPQECTEVNHLLSTVHGTITPPTTIPEPSLTVTGCGEVPSVLDALIRTLLSGATTGSNSALAFNGLVKRFGILSEGVGKGSVDWDKVRRAPVGDVFEAIKSGGLADIKSRNIKGILDLVYKENQERRDALVSHSHEQREHQLQNSPNTNAKEEYEITCADQHVLSLNHLHALPTEQVMSHLTNYPGIGPKTAACVILFCLQRPCFAVDTHIFRIAKWLGWLPDPSSFTTGNIRVTEVTAFGHLEVRIPDHLKYSLHQLMIRHGKSCARCRAITGEGAAGWESGCVIEHLVRRTGKRKLPRKDDAKDIVGRKRSRKNMDVVSDRE